MKACTGKTEAMDLEANPKEMESEAKHEKSLRKRMQWKILSTEEAVWGLAYSCKAPQSLSQSLVELSPS
jgi:hypothetical protein